MLKNLKVIKWEFGEDTKNTCLCSKKISIAKGAWDGLMFSINGLGLSKFEREIFNKKFLEFDGRLTIFFLKWYLSYNRKGIYDEFESVNIVYDRKVKFIIKDKIRELKQKVKTARENILRKFKFKDQYNFSIVKSFEGEYSFKSDLLSAFQLASNYEACLYMNGRLIFSPLGFEWEENNKAIKKYLGLSWKNLGYKNPWSKEIKEYKEVKYQ